jgi:nucleoside-diphosphate-sugar epimerase
VGFKRGKVKRIFVTGGSGFIGTNLIESLVEAGHDVVNFDNIYPRSPQHAWLFQEGDILDGVRLSVAVRDFRPELCVHLAARTDLDGTTIADYDANTIGVRNMIAAAQSVGTVSRILFASSRYVHRTEVFPKHDDDYSPFTPYGESKVETERIIRSSGLEIPWAIFRPTSIWGPWFRIPYRTFFDTVRRGVYVHPRGRKISKSYGYVGNVVNQILQFLFVDAARIDKRTFYVSDDQNMDVLDFAHLIQQAFGAPAIREVPLAVLQGLAIAGDLLKKMGVSNPPITSFRLANLLTPMDYDLSLTTQVAGPAPYTLGAGVQSTVEWILKHG